MSLDSSDRTEPATQRRRLALRELGQVARSADLTSATMVLASALALRLFGAGLAGTLRELLRESLSQPAWSAIEPARLAEHAWHLARLAAGALLPLLALTTLAAVAVNTLQVGFLASAQPLVPDLQRINPVAGFQRLLGSRTLGRLVSSLVKLGVVAAMTCRYVSQECSAFAIGGSLPAAAFAKQAGHALSDLGLQLAAGLAGLAVLDYGYQLWSFERAIRMTKQEVRDELRETEGDPQLRQQRRELWRRRQGEPPTPRHPLEAAPAA